MILSSALQTLLAAATDKADWSNILNSALGVFKRVRVFDGATECRNVAVSQTGIVADDSGLYVPGVFSDNTASAATNLAAGNGTVRIEGGGHTVTLTLGLTGSGKELTLPANLGANGALANAGINLAPPAGLPLSTTIPAAPSLDADAPNLVTLEDWTTGSAVTVGTITLDTRIADYVTEDTDLAQQMGNVRVTQSSGSIVHGAGGYAFEFGATMWSLHAGCNADDPTKPVHQVLIQCKPYGRWASYPARTNYNRATDSTFPKPFKIRIKKADGTTLKLHEMHDGLPINDPSLSQTRTTSAPLRPLFHCAMALPWESAKLKKSAIAGKYFPGMATDILRPSQAKKPYTTNGLIPLIDDTGQINGINNYFAMPQWPLSTNTGVVDGIGGDAYGYDAGGTEESVLYRPRRSTGVYYEPGSISGHDWYTGPGGVRFDRYALPSILALYMTEPTGARLKGGELWRDLVDHWRYAQFNHAKYFVTNAKTLATVPNAEVLNGEWMVYNGYYNGDGGALASQSIDMVGKGNGSAGTNTGASKFDLDGRRPWNGYLPDYLHCYNTSGWWSLIFNSPMDAYGAKMCLNNAIMAQDYYAPANMQGEWTSGSTAFLGRQHAWRWLHYAMQWALGSTHALGYSRAEIEGRWVDEIESIYTDVYTPTMVTNNTGKAFTGLRNLGVVVNGNNYAASNSMTFYMGAVFALMKQSGAWDVMYAKSAHAAAVMDFMMTCMIKYSCDWILDTDGRVEEVDGPNYQLVGTPVPADWAAWSARYPKTGSEDWIRNSSGAFLVGRERAGSQHLRAQFACIVRDYFPTYVTTKVTNAIAKYQGYYDAIAADVAAKGTAQLKVDADWTYRHPAAGIWLAPTA